MPSLKWEFAVISQGESQKARVAWLPGRRLPEELVPIAVSLGYTAASLAIHEVGELKDDLVLDKATYLRGALVLPDEEGYPAALFGRPLVATRAKETKAVSCN